MTINDSSGQGHGQVSTLHTLLVLSVNTAANTELKVKGINTSYDPDQADNQNHLCVHLNIREKSEVNIRGLNTGCNPNHVDLLYQRCC